MHFVDSLILDILRALPFRRNQTVQSAGGYCIRISSWKYMYVVNTQQNFIRRKEATTTDYMFRPKHVVYCCCFFTSNKVLLCIDYIHIFSARYCWTYTTGMNRLKTVLEFWKNKIKNSGWLRKNLKLKSFWRKLWNCRQTEHWMNEWSAAR